jgi:hypothetical protein
LFGALDGAGKGARVGMLGGRVVCRRALLECAHPFTFACRLLGYGKGLRGGAFHRLVETGAVFVNGGGCLGSVAKY